MGTIFNRTTYMLSDGLVKVLDEENTIIKEQTPNEGIKINKGNKIFITY